MDEAVRGHCTRSRPAYCIALHSWTSGTDQIIALHCIAMHWITLYHITSDCISFSCNALQYTSLHWITLHYIKVHYIALHSSPSGTDQIIPLHYITFFKLKCIRLSIYILLYHIALYCIWYWPVLILHHIGTMLHYAALHNAFLANILYSKMQYIAIYCILYCTISHSILHYIALHCTKLHYVAFCIALYIAIYCTILHSILHSWQTYAGDPRGCEGIAPSVTGQSSTTSLNTNKHKYKKLFTRTIIFVKFNLAKLDKAEPGKRQLRSPDEKGPMHPEAGAGGGNWQRIAPPP